MAYTSPYSTPIVIEQGGSMMNVASTGSIVLAAGATLTNSGTQTVSSGGSVTIASGATVTVSGTVSVPSAGSVTFAAGARLGLGNSNFEFGSNIPSHLASPGTFYFRSDGSISNVYCNVSAGSSGSVWKGASLFVS